MMAALAAMMTYDKGISWVVAAYLVTWGVHVAYLGSVVTRIKRAREDWEEVNRAQ
jgi:hypothetical protein